MTTRLLVACFPSSQDTNAFEGTNEQAQMERLADQLAAVNGRTSGTSGIYLRVFKGKAYSQGDWRDNLKAQLQEGHAWLDGAPAGVPTVSLSLHTDGVGWTHVGFYWDGKAPGSKELGADIAYRIGPLFGTSKITNADYGASEYYFTTEAVCANGARPHRPVLLEIGDHLVAADNRVVATQGEQISQRIVDGLVNVFHLPTVPPPPVVPPEPPQPQWDQDAVRASVAKIRADLAALEVLLK